MVLLYTKHYQKIIYLSRSLARQKSGILELNIPVGCNYIIMALDKFKKANSIIEVNQMKHRMYLLRASDYTVDIQIASEYAVKSDQITANLQSN